MSLLLFPFIYSRNVSTFFRSFRKTVVVSYVFHLNFALKIGEQPPRIDPLAQARCLIAVLFWSRFRRQREALWAKCAQISKLETLESLDLLIESYFTDCSFFKDHVINKIDFFFYFFCSLFLSPVPLTSTDVSSSIHVRNISPVKSIKNRRSEASWLILWLIFPPHCFCDSF